MDNTTHKLLEDIAASLRRIAAALEASPHAAPQRGDDAEHAACILDEETVRQTPVDPVSAPHSLSAASDASDTGAEQGGVCGIDRLDILRDFLADRGISIKVERERDETDEVLDRLALFIGSRFPQVKGFYSRLKSNMNNGRAFTMNLRDKPQDVISSTCQLATELHKIAFLEEYWYRNSPKCQLYARPSRFPKALNFLSGGWLERYAVSVALGLARERVGSGEVSYIKNPQIVLPNGDDFELDVLLEVSGEIYWMELKTGNYQRYIAKYSRMSRLLDLPKERCFMVLSDISPDVAASLSTMFQMTVTSVEDVSSVLDAAMARCL